MQALKTADHDAKELQEMPAATINKLNRDTTERSPTNTRPAYHKALRIAVTTVEENTLHQIVGFINWSAGFPRRQVTLKQSAILNSSRRGPGDILQFVCWGYHWGWWAGDLRRILSVQYSEQSYTHNGHIKTKWMIPYIYGTRHWCKNFHCELTSIQPAVEGK